MTTATHARAQASRLTLAADNPNPQRTADRRAIWREHNQPKGSTLYRISYDGPKPRAAHFI